MSDETVEVEARRLVTGPRQAHYDPPEINFTRIAQAWSGYLGIEITPIDVANLMTLLKVLRTKGKGFQRDSVVDAIGYQIIVEMLDKKLGEKKSG